PTPGRKGIGQRSQVILLLHGPLDYSREARHRLRSLADVLDIVLREELREALGGTYGVNVGASANDEPDSTYSFTISFTAAPERVDEMVAAVFAQIDSLKAHGPEAETVEKVREQQRRERETAMETNPFWVSVL